jgi:membrane protease YdiL (CAAX protease family)
MDWLLGDPLGRTFLVFPFFAAVMLALSLARGLYPESVIRHAAPILYVLMVWAVLLYAAQQFPFADAVDLLGRRLSLEPKGLGAAFLGIAAVPFLYLLELAIADRWLSWREGRRSRNWGRSFVLPIGTDTIEVGSPMDAREAFDTVREIGRKPLYFACLSVATAVGEELLYRGLMLEQLRAGSILMAGVIAVQSLAYAVNHLPFGVPAFVGKFAVGLVFGFLVVVGDSLYPVILAHLLLQVLVWRRLRRSDAEAQRTGG